MVKLKTYSLECEIEIIHSALIKVKTTLFKSICDVGFVNTVLNPSRGVLIKCIFLLS